MDSNINQAIKAAVDWWADQLIQLPHYDDGDTSAEGRIKVLMSEHQTASEPIPSKAAIATFRDSLARQLDDLYAQSTKNGCSFKAWIEVDYDPDSMLKKALTDADIDKTLPCKTSMKISEGKVAVSCGYGKPFQGLWQSTQIIEQG
ncbi:MAG: hypothetical protein AAGF24_12175 [Cyanobacteria bacterium P01_H01_bin.121]